MAYKCIHLPVGYQVAIRASTDPDWVDLGVTKDAGTLEFTYDAVKITGSQAEGVLNYAKNMVMNATFSLYQQELSNINRLMSGATAYTSTASAPVNVTAEVKAVGWARETFIPFANQSFDGSVPTGITVSNPGALVLNTDYNVIKSNGKWGIVVLATRGNLSNVLSLAYTYTPAASRTLTAGASSINVAPRQIRIRKLLDASAGKYWTVYIYAAVNTNGLSFSLPRYDEDEPSALEVQMSGQLDTSRTSMDQLFSIVDEFGTDGI
jgi:hypothetical protein